MVQHINFEKDTKGESLEEVSFFCFAPIGELKSELRKISWVPPGGMIKAITLVIFVILLSSLYVYAIDMLSALLLRGISSSFNILFS